MATLFEPKKGAQKWFPLYLYMYIVCNSKLIIHFVDTREGLQNINNKNTQKRKYEEDSSDTDEEIIVKPKKNKISGMCKSNGIIPSKEHPFMICQIL